MALAGVLVLVWGALSRFLHLDGLADTADGLVYTAGRERSLEIMKDSRLGAFGLCAVAGILLIKFGALASLDAESLCRSLFIAPVLGRATGRLSFRYFAAGQANSGLGASAAGQGLFPLFASAAGASGRGRPWPAEWAACTPPCLVLAPWALSWGCGSSAAWAGSPAIPWGPP